MAAKEYAVFNDEKPFLSIPTHAEIVSFYRNIFFKSQMEVDCIIMSLIYIDRLIKQTDGRLRPCTYNWRSLLFSTMILSSKVWDDLSMWNSDFSTVCNFTLERTNELELATLRCLKYSVKVTAAEYTLYYFKLRENKTIKLNIPLDMESVRLMEKCSSSFQRKNGASRRSRVKSEGVDDMCGSPRASLEHVVKM